MAENEICGTKDPTFHRVLLDTRFELPLGILAVDYFLQYCIWSTLVLSFGANLRFLYFQIYRRRKPDTGPRNWSSSMP